MQKHCAYYVYYCQVGYEVFTSGFKINLIFNILFDLVLYRTGCTAGMYAEATFQTWVQ